jgi:hypothetical protein
MFVKKIVFVCLAFMPPIIWALAAENLGLPTDFKVGSKPFSEKLVINNIEFKIASQNSSSRNSVEIVPVGFKKNLEVIKTSVEGVVTGAETADLNNDGYPEVYVYINSADKSAYGSILAFASNKNLSLSPIYLPALNESSKDAASYNGRDEFSVVENRLMRRFPVVSRNGVQRYRQIQYRLIAGEAGWILKVDRVDSF